MASNQVVLTYSATSNSPAEVIQAHHDQDGPVPGDEKPLPEATALVTFLVAPINPQDVMAIAGRYPVKPEYRHLDNPIPGNDGVARVEATNPPPPTTTTNHNPLPQPGDLVIPQRHGLGTWRRHAILPLSALTRLPLPNMNPLTTPTPTATSTPSAMIPHITIDPIAASMLRTVFLPAYLLTEDMRALRPGDWVVQNAAGSTVAQVVAQFVRRKGARVVAVVRERERERDGGCGGGGMADVDVVLTEREVREGGVGASGELKAAAERGRVVLGLDAVFGAAGEALAGLLSRGATYVNYGSLGGVDGVVRVSQKMVFWNEVRFRNFRLSEQLGKRSVMEQEDLLGWLADLIARGELRAPVVERIPVPMDGSFVEAFQEKVKGVLAAAAEKKIGHRKHVLDFAGAGEV
ncbi:predicted protein [Chaetomium globosum CBS 148.51]|uniref:Enoyl reductase (ER) domain-containing protein n=1 Tax=Chaetomium globosum (strain ATCC 6205 / CBS 148.51 / DSM 1962 / NBRC 6347 / NRRL 1970) TaxID=306901 RepID=Q2H8G0_CHAGB|nr:uncharacterized protein CHGG_03494 [Chaetomium globosum CBS 148.51]EAQ91559.1 predicted protein [Chaetomium globosum CBS 148.51]